jgi:hypothetical protein
MGRLAIVCGRVDVTRPLRLRERHRRDHRPAGRRSQRCMQPSESGASELISAKDDQQERRIVGRSRLLRHMDQKSCRERVAARMRGADLLQRRGVPHCPTGDAPELRGEQELGDGLLGAVASVASLASAGPDARSGPRTHARVW